LSSSMSLCIMCSCSHIWASSKGSSSGLTTTEGVDSVYQKDVHIFDIIR
jgi:hypothetical protein